MFDDMPNSSFLQSKASSWGDCYRQTLQLALPILIAHVVEALIPFVNVKFAAELGEVSLAASGLAGSVFFAVMGFCWGVVVAIGIMTGHRIGAGAERSHVGLVLWAGLVLSLLLSLPVMSIFKNMDFFWHHAGQNPQVIEQAQRYMDGLLLAVPADLAKFAIFQFAIACNQPRIPLMANLISVPLLVGINYFLIQKFGIYGVGLGTSITYWLVGLSMLAFILMNPFFRRYLIHVYSLKAFTRLMLEQLKLGVPIGFMFSIELLFFMVVILLMGYFGTTVLAANQVAMQWMGLTIMLAFGFTEAVTILVSRAHGAKDYSLVMRMTFAGSVLALAVTFLIVLFYWFLPDLIIQADLEKTEQTLPVFQLAAGLLVFCGFYQLVDSARIVIAGALRGMGDSQYPMWVTVIGFWLIGLPIGYSCAFLLNMQASGLWVGLLAGTASGALIQYFRLYKKTRLSV